jgi:hypothetical protein
MAGLNNLISNTAQQTTTLPSWFDTAQQNVVSQAGQALGAAPTPQNTVGQQAVNALSGPTNAFTTAGGTLQQIASGAANPWLTDTSTGQVTPDTSTALGGLFQAQNQQLQQLMPNITAPVQGANIASGQFGSLRGQTAVNKAMGDAQAQLAAQQMQAALTNQATGVNAAQGAGNVAQQNINNLLTTGQYQQAAPFTNVSNYGKVLGGIQAPTTVSNQTQLSPINQIGGLLSLAGGSSSGGILGQLFGTAASGNPTLPNGQPNPAYKAPTAGVLGGLGGLPAWLKGLTEPAAQSTGTFPLQGGGSLQINADGSETIINADGTRQYYDASGNPTTVAQDLQNQNIIPAPDTSNLSGGDTSAIDNTDWSQYTNPTTE